jgi:hypothetical protein
VRDFPEALKLARQAGASASIPAMHLRSVEVALSAELPRDYKLLLEKVGLPRLPGLPEVVFHDPATICAYGASIFNLEEKPPGEWPCLPIARVGASGDDLGLLREGGVFLPELRHFDHELLWRGPPENWSLREADSVCTFVVRRLQPDEDG